MTTIQKILLVVAFGLSVANFFAMIRVISAHGGKI